MDTQPPVVSVLMTAYNREKYITEAIESVLSSTYTNFELIIVDDGSTDNTVKIANAYAAKDSRIRVYQNEKNLGDYVNRNKAASYSAARYIKYLDSDDRMYPYGLQEMVNGMEQFPGAGFGLSSMPQLDKHYPLCIEPHEIYKEHFEGFGHFDRAPGSAIINREAFNSVGGFTGKRMIGDYELWFTLARTFSLVKLQRDLVWDRIHPDQERQTDYAKRYAALKKEIFDTALAHAGCPLSAEEKKKYTQEKMITRSKRIVKKILGR
ncbi:MAG: glycosyltransferase family 2 protein [Ferruginibacter sp.]